MEQTFYKKDSDTSSAKKSSAAPKIVLGFVFLLILAVGAIIGLYVIGAEKRKELASVVIPPPTPTQTITPTPLASISAQLSASPSGTLPRNLLRIAVLNGSGTPGAAQGTSSYLQKTGYAVVSVTNADRFDYRNLTVFVKTNKSQYLPQLKKDLETYSGVGAVTASVSGTIVSDAEVIVGR